MGAEVSHDPEDLGKGSLRRIRVRWPKPHTEELIFSEDGERQITIRIGNPKEEALGLLSVKRDVGRIEPEHHLLGRLGMRFKGEIDQSPIDGFG